MYKLEQVMFQFLEKNLQVDFFVLTLHVWVFVYCMWIVVMEEDFF